MSLLSIEFVALASLAAVGLPLLAPRFRAALFLALDAWFIQSYIDLYGAMTMATIVVGGYLFARAACSGRRLAVPAGVAVLTGAFAYARGYGVLDPLLPDIEIGRRLSAAGLSFMYFKVLHVVIDSGGRTLGSLRPTVYALYCLNFTTFLMGPIQRYQHFEEQWSGRVASVQPGFEAHLDALNRILRGMVKAFVLVELVRPFALQSGLDFASMSRSEIIYRVYAFYAFLYLDFSGYCDIMIGIGSLMGVRPPENFDLPFLSRNVAEYWLRVHRSLTQWLTDYVFNPIFAGALRNPRLRSMPFVALSGALMATMCVSGLWHGTTLAFLCFGLVHGAFLVIHRGYEQLASRTVGRAAFARWSKRVLVRAGAVVLTFQAASFAYVFFALDLEQASTVFRRLLGA